MDAGSRRIAFEGGRLDGQTIAEATVRSYSEDSPPLSPLPFDAPGHRYVVYHNDPRPFEPAPEIYEVTDRRDLAGHPVHRYVRRA